MPRFEYDLVDVFTSELFGGNPLAVFRDARGIDPQTMQRIARELNLSETTFVLPSPRSDCDVQVRIFTPRAEMPTAGHPTVGTAWVLAHGERVTFLEGVGPVPVERRRMGAEGKTVWCMTQPLPAWGESISVSDAARLLGVGTADIDVRLPAATVSGGVPFLFVSLRSLQALAASRIDPGLWQECAQSCGASGVFCFCVVEAGERTVARSRMFAPDFGVPEDPATGSASGPLGCHLVRHGIAPATETTSIVNLQGFEMGRPSRIEIEIAGGPTDFSAVRVGGDCVAVGGGHIDL